MTPDVVVTGRSRLTRKMPLRDVLVDCISSPHPRILRESLPTGIPSTGISPQRAPVRPPEKILDRVESSGSSAGILA